LGNALYQYSIWTTDIDDSDDFYDAFYVDLDTLDLNTGYVNAHPRDGSYGGMDVLCRE
jgi:hypothetical protein